MPNLQIWNGYQSRKLPSNSVQYLWMFIPLQLFERKKIFYCERCYNLVSIEFADFLSYLYFATMHQKIIGSTNKCKIKGCNFFGTPNRFGYCGEHQTSLSSNKAVILSFMYYSRFVNNVNEETGNNIFIEIVKYMNEHHKFAEPEEVDFFQVKSILNKDNILHE